MEHIDGGGAVKAEGSRVTEPGSAQILVSLSANHKLFLHPFVPALDGLHSYRAHKTWTQITHN